MMNFELAEKLLVSMMSGRTPSRKETDEIIEAALYAVERFEQMVPNGKIGEAGISYLSSAVGRGKG